MVTLAVAAMLVMAPTATLAQKGNPHFVGQQPQITLSGATASVNTFKIAGLPSGSTITGEFTVSGSATVQCIPSGQQQTHGKNAPGLTSVQGSKTATQTFTADKNGNLVVNFQPVTLTQADFDVTNACPDDQQPRILGITATSATLTLTGPSGFNFSTSKP